MAGGIVAPLVVLGLVAATALSGKPYAGALHVLARIGLVTAGDRALPRRHRRHRARRHCHRGPRSLLATPAAGVGDRGTRRRRPPRVHREPVFARARVRPGARHRPTRCRPNSTAMLGPDGRYLIVDPARSGGVALNQVGAPDTNVMSGLSSAQGYGSLTWAPYASATGTHTQDDLTPAALATGVFDSLDVRVLLTGPRRALPRRPAPNQLPSRREHAAGTFRPSRRGCGARPVADRARGRQSTPAGGSVVSSCSGR